MGDSKTDKRNDKILRTPRTRTIRSLNDLYVLAGLTSQALLEMQKRVAENDDGDDVEFEAPAANGESTVVTRDASQLLAPPPSLMPEACMSNCWLRELR